MKKLLLALSCIIFASGVFAQKGYYHRPNVARPHVSIGIGSGFGYYPFYRPYYPFYGPMYGYGYSVPPSRLSLEIQDIKQDYSDRIKSVKINKDIPRRERKQMIAALKIDRDRAITDAQKNYYYKRRGQS